MRKRYKVILNVEIEDPNNPYPAAGDYTHLTRIEGVIRGLTRAVYYPDGVQVTLDKVVEKGEVNE